MDERALYACDQCYRCKTRCDKQLPKCGRCTHQSATCTYSVTGVETINTASSSSSSTLDSSPHSEALYQRPTPTSAPTSAYEAQTWPQYAGDSINVWADSVQSQPSWYDAELDRQQSFFMPAMGNPIATANTSQPYNIAHMEPSAQAIPLPADSRSVQGSQQTTKSCRCIQATLEASTIASRVVDSNNGVDPPDIAAVGDASNAAFHASKCCMLHDTATFMSTLLFIQKQLGCIRLAIQFPTTINVALDLRMRSLAILALMETSLATDESFSGIEHERRGNLKVMIKQLQDGYRSCYWSSGEETYY